MAGTGTEPIAEPTTRPCAQPIAEPIGLGSSFYPLVKERQMGSLVRHFAFALFTALHHGVL